MLAVWRMQALFVVLRILLLTAGAQGLASCSALSPPLESEEVSSFASGLERELALTEPMPAGPLTMEMAVDLAVERNRSVRAKQLAAALAQAKVMVESGAMLPTAMADSGYAHRDRLPVSRSSMYSTYSSSSVENNLTKDITLGWSILDFGLSYVRARQALDQARKQEEDGRRAAHEIAEETIKAFWRAVAFRKLAPGMAALEADVSEAFRLSRAASKDRAIDPIESIDLQRNLLDVQREVADQLVDLAGAEEELKELLGAPPGQDLLLDETVAPRTQRAIAPSAVADVTMALRRRPEIRQYMYDLRIGEDEVYARILEALPGVTLTRSYAADDNPYLLNGNWVSWGASIAGDLVRLVRLRDELNVVAWQQRFDRQMALATAAAIVMQVHVARAKVAVNEHAYRLAAQSAEVQHRLLAHTGAAVKAGKLGKQRLVRERLETILSDIRIILALADYQAALAGYVRTLGIDAGNDHLSIGAPAAGPFRIPRQRAGVEEAGL